MYFKDFPQTLYKFGDAESFVRFQQLNTYVNLIDQYRDDVTVYEKYIIQPGERADTLSFRLYGTTDYHWTFFVANDNIRESGWPLDRSRIYETAQKNYPHRAITTATNIGNTNFKKGQVVTGSQSGSTGPIIEVKLDLGIIIVNANGNFNDGRDIKCWYRWSIHRLVLLLVRSHSMIQYTITRIQIMNIQILILIALIHLD